MIGTALKFCSWNIHGYKSREIGNKFCDEEFLNIFKNNDFIGLTETHLHDEILDKMNIPGFHCMKVKNRRKNLKSNTAAKGIAVFVNDNIKELFSVVEIDNEDVIWVKISKELSGEEKDLYIGTCYFKPSKGGESAREIDKLTENITFFKNKGNVIINGDFNAKTGNLEDTISPDKSDEEFNITFGNPPLRRNSQDTAVNGRGNEMLDMCKALDLNIINGRKTGDLFGNYTCFQWNGNSVVDYLLTSASLFHQISYLKIGEFLPWLSDHCPVHFTLEFHNKKTTKTQTTPPKIKAPKQFVWSEMGRQRFLDILMTEDFQGKLETCLQLNYTYPNNAVDHITNVLIDAAGKAKIKSVQKRELRDAPWFDKFCKSLKEDIKLLGKKIKCNPKNQSFKTQLSTLKKRLKKLVKSNKIAYKNKLIEQMNYSKKDSKKFWKILDKMEQKPDDVFFKRSISEQRWTAHFKTIFQSPNGKTPLPENTSERGPLDYEISDEEIKLGAYILKNGKAPGHDSISNEMLSCLLEVNPWILTKLFNALLQNPTSIDKWNISMISPVYKTGSKINPDNYRAISLLSCFSKFFLSIINLRLTKFAIEQKLFSNSQLGFLSGCRTSDALLILYNLVDFYCKKQNQYIFGCFVDFKKAFDSVPRDVIFQKLLNRNINGKFYDCLISIYSKDMSCIKIGDTITEPFSTNQGVKQGCILSPTLFNIFLSDCQNITEQGQCEPVQIQEGLKLGCLIWADDLILLSESEAGLKNMLAALKSYTIKNGMTINIKKTKVMIFNKGGRHIRRDIRFGNDKLETTRQYKYLGFMVTPSGEITTGLKDLKDRALRALFKMKNKLGITFRKYPLVSLKLFRTLIEPILLYASDFWGILKLPKNNPIENVFLSFCKQLLGVQKQTTNIGVLLELGQVPLSTFAKNNSIKNWVRIVTKTKCNGNVLKSHENAVSKNLTWITRLESTLSQIGMRELFLVKDQETHKKAFQRMKDIFHQEAFSEIQKEGSKLRTYGRFKTLMGYEEYLSDIRNVKERTSLTKLRLSNHPLMIEKGRHLKIERNARFCPFCPDTIEDEIHFLINCKCFSGLRNTLFNRIREVIPPFPYTCKIRNFIVLMKYRNISGITAQYVSKAFEIREFLMAKHRIYL